MPKSEYYVDPLNGSDTTGDGLSDATAWRSVQHALDNITKNTTSGDRINVKDSADDVLSGTLDFTTIGAYANTYSLVIQGYTSTAGDGGIGGIDGGGVRVISQGYVNLKDMRLHNAGSSTLASIGSCTVDSCTFENGLDGISGNAITILNSRFYNLTRYGINGYYMLVHSSHFENGTNKMSYCIVAGSGFGRTFSVTNCTFSIDSSTNGIFSSSGCPVMIINNSILSNGGTGSGVWLNKDVYGSTIAGNLIEGFSGSGGIGIERQVNASTRDIGLLFNSVYDCDTDYQVGDYYSLYEGNESLAASPFAKTGANTFENRFSYFAPADVGNVLSGGVAGQVRGAVPQPAGGGTGGGLLRVNMNGNVFG